MLGMVFMAFVIGLVFLVCLKYRAKLIIWIFILSFLGVLISSAIVSGFSYKNDKDVNGSQH